MNEAKANAKDWSSFKFDAADSRRQLKLFRLLKGLCWVGNVGTAALFIQDMLMGTRTTLDLRFFIFILLGFAFGFGTFQCEKKIKFIRYQTSYFSNQER